MADEEHLCDHDHPQLKQAETTHSREVVERAAEMFRAAGEPARLRLLERLAQGEACVSELAAESGDGLSTVSQRLKTLRNAKLVVRRRDGKHVFYQLADDHVAALIASALDHAFE